MSKDKNRRRKSVENVVVVESRNESAVAVTEKIPLVSVVIPMFNGAKFIPQTLESLLYQTLKDFEVVVVDDCSTDNSVEVVESLAKNFNGRLKLVKLPKNTGRPGIPRNVGIQFARGKYISLLDSDDLYTKTALEEQASLAEKFQADVVHMNDTFKLFGGQALPVDDPRMTDFNELTNPKNFRFTEWRWPMPRPKPIAEPTLMSDDLEERVKIWLNWQYRWVTYSTFCRRDFLTNNQIYFSSVSTGQDVPFCFECMCAAKRCLQVPNVVYIVRPRAGSVSHENFNADFEKYFRRRVAAFNETFNEFERIMDKFIFFKQHTNYRYAMLNWFANQRMSFSFQNIYEQIPAFKLNELIKKEFPPDDAAFVSYLFNTANVYRLQIMKLQQQIAALKKSNREVSNVQR